MDFTKYFWQQRQLEKALEVLQPSTLLLDAIPTVLVEQIHELQLLSERFTLPGSYIATFEEIQRTIDVASINQSFPELATQPFNVPQVYADLGRKLAEMIATLPEGIESATLALQETMAESLVPPETLLRLGNITKQSVDVSLRSHLAFADYMDKQINLASHASEAIRTNTLKMITSASELILPMSRGSELVCLLWPQLSIEDSAELPEVNVFTVLKEEQPSSDEKLTETEIEEAVSSASSSKIVSIGAKLVKLVYNLNVEAEYEGRKPIFKPTSKTMLAFHVIPSRIAEDEGSFSDVVNYLYFLLYEGSGKANRLTKLRPTESFEALWTLKHLRLGFCHDVDHGSATESRENAMKVGQAYQTLIGQYKPRSKGDWINAQIELYRSLTEMLEDLWYNDYEVG